MRKVNFNHKKWKLIPSVGVFSILYFVIHPILRICIQTILKRVSFHVKETVDLLNRN